jgi:hypothetical protein
MRNEFFRRIGELFCCNAYVRFWHKADKPRLTAICLLSEQSGHAARAAGVSI